MANDWRCGSCLRQPPYCARRGSSAVCTRCRDEFAAKGLKWCSGCGTALPLDRFAIIGGKQGDRRRGQCYRCRQPLKTAGHRRWKQRYPERVKAHRKQWEAANREKVRRWRHQAYRRSVAKIWKRGTK